MEQYDHNISGHEKYPCYQCFLDLKISNVSTGALTSFIGNYLQGVISSALYFGLMTWAISRVGPLFVASYIPVQPVFATILALIFLGSTVYLGG